MTKQQWLSGAEGNVPFGFFQYKKMERSVIRLVMVLCKPTSLLCLLLAD
jgi:hypothetical protein